MSLLQQRESYKAFKLQKTIFYACFFKCFIFTTTWLRDTSNQQILHNALQYFYFKN